MSIFFWLNDSGLTWHMVNLIKIQFPRSGNFVLIRISYLQKYIRLMATVVLMKSWFQSRIIPFSMFTWRISQQMGLKLHDFCQSKNWQFDYFHSTEMCWREDQLLSCILLSLVVTKATGCLSPTLTVAPKCGITFRAKESYWLELANRASSACRPNCSLQPRILEACITGRGASWWQHDRKRRDSSPLFCSYMKFQADLS